MTDWPETVPILTAEDMCIVPLERGKCGCLSEWMSRCFDDVMWNSNDDESLTVAMIEAHNQLGTHVPKMNALNETYFTYQTNRFAKTTRVLAARVWNRAMAILGYVVNNPECTKSGKLKPVR